MNITVSPTSAGLGLRRAMLADLMTMDAGAVDFLECAPDNWIGVGGVYAQQLDRLAEQYPITCHGLSLSLGGAQPLDLELLRATRGFLDRYAVTIYSEHLSYCADQGHLYDLLPIPFTDEAVHHVAARIRQAQDVLGQRIAVENISYYAAPFQAMSEIDFIRAVLDEADCDLLLDVNNLYVNAINHRYDASEFLAAIPTRRVTYLHVAGHYDEADDLKIDTHGASVKQDVWALLHQAYERLGPVPTLLERDFNFPPLPQLLAEIDQIKRLQQFGRQTGLEAQHVRTIA
ncbi:protein of unknown function, DUF692 family [Pseudomonas fluorescens Q2-87]|uniref:UPF0276 protein PflQ2_2367 n=1 Tax=Pseudomonas fluorescens (strain Q2-87) TaxID=1038922 RepID=J2Y8D1_PSEFQ|nr:DUF692 domain-containing protein [Pseudomonas fluorescens]EJL03139.1 protein of unknown function, DUF692 family [Pseudomonas fluorescens Q2-87]